MPSPKKRGKTTASDYRKNLEEDPEAWATVPKALALEWLGITAPTFDRWARDGKIRQIEIEGYRSPFTLAESVLGILREREGRKGKILAALEECARKGGTVTYSDESARDHGFMLSALGVLKGSGAPSEGFFGLAGSLAEEYRGKKGRKHLASYGEDSRKAWLDEDMRMIYNHYAGGSDG